MENIWDGKVSWFKTIEGFRLKLKVLTNSCGLPAIFPAHRTVSVDRQKWFRRTQYRIELFSKRPLYMGTIVNLALKSSIWFCPESLFAREFENLKMSFYPSFLIAYIMMFLELICKIKLIYVVRLNNDR